MEQQRRDFLGMAFGGFAAVGVASSLVAIKKTWDPLPSVMAAGFTVSDLSPMQKGELRTVQWRGKPIYILKKTDEMEKNDKRDVMAGKDRFTIFIALCTHLGCIPNYIPKEKHFFCACHAGVFNLSGENTFGPPPRPLEIPPFKLEGNKITFGEIGEQYKKLTGKTA